MSRPIEVSKGRFVDLSGEPPTPEAVLRDQLQKIIFNAKFTRKAIDFESKIINVIKECQEQRKHIPHQYDDRKPPKNPFSPKKRRGRKSEEELRFYLIGSLWETWFRGTQKLPIVNNKGNERTPFVTFVAAIFDLINMGKVEDYLEDYQSYRQATFEGKSYTTWVAERGRS
jgi:hypothetical protein